MSEMKRVLVIDDEPVVCNSCRKVLEQEGYDVCVSTNSQEGLNKVSEEHFDAAIIDLRMPGIGGMEVLRVVKTRRPETQVIIITAYSSVSTAVEAKQLGAADYLSKPFTPQELTDRMRSVFGAGEENWQPWRGKTELPPRAPSLKGFGRSQASLPAEARVLLAGADTEQMVSICRCLFAVPWEVTTSETCEEIIGRIRSGQADVLITGLDVFGMPAYDLIARIRQLGSKIPVIVASADASTEEMQKLRELGIFFHMTEPFDPSEIRCAVRDAVRRSEELSTDDRTPATRSTFIRSLRTLTRDGRKVGFVALGNGMDQNSGLYRRVIGELNRRNVPVRINLARGIATATEFPKYLKQDQKVVILTPCNGNGGNGRVMCYSAAEFEKLATAEQLGMLREVAYPQVLHWLRVQGITPEVKIVCFPDSRLRSDIIGKTAEAIVNAGMA